MACCNKKTTQFQTQGAPSNPLRPPVRPFPQPAPPRRVVFRYNGRTALTVVGPISGKRYRFEGPGARVEVDPRDRRSLIAVPNLVLVN